MIYFVSLVLVAILIYIIYTYNRLIGLHNMVREAWSGVDVQLQKRHDLIPAIVKMVSGYATHEKALFENITKLRASATQSPNRKDTEAIELDISKALGNLVVIAENYPELKANQNFLELQKELSKVENDLQYARRYYNGSVRNYNVLIEQFPSNLIAKTFKHHQEDYFDLKNESEKLVPVLIF